MTLPKSLKRLLFLVLFTLEHYGEYGNCVKPAVKASSYLKICHRSDPQLNKCMKDSFERLRPFLAKGIPELKIPSFEPLIIPEIIMNQGKGSSMNLQTTYRNLHMWGVSQFELKDFRANLENDQLHFHIMFPNLVTKALYEINGRLLMLPINGNGIKEGNYTNVEGNVLIQGSRLRLNDTTYFHVNNVLIDLDVGHVSIHFNNLFNGDRELGEAMNTFINDNWRHVMKDMKPVLEQTIGEVVKGLFNAIYNKFPLEEILPFFLSMLISLSYLKTIEADSVRSLVVRNGGVIKLTIGVIMPVELPVSLVWLQNLQFQYSMIENAAQLNELNLLRRSQSFSLTRDSAYTMIAQIWDGFGINGTACVLRTICEVSRLPSSKHSLLGSIFANIFTPHPKTDSIYITAAAKKPNENCRRYRSHCMEKLSTLMSQFTKNATNK